MKRRSFIKSVLKGLVVIPVVGLVVEGQKKYGIIPVNETNVRQFIEPPHFEGTNDYIELPDDSFTFKKMAELYEDGNHVIDNPNRYYKLNS